MQKQKLASQKHPLVAKMTALQFYISKDFSAQINEFPTIYKLLLSLHVCIVRTSNHIRGESPKNNNNETKQLSIASSVGFHADVSYHPIRIVFLMEFSLISQGVHE